MGIYNFIVGVWGVMRKISQVGIVLIFILGAIYIFMPKTDKAEMLSSANTNQSEYTSLSRLRMDIVDKRLTEMSASPSGALLSGIIRGMNCKFAGMLCEDKTKGEMEHFGGSLMGLATKGLIVPFVQPPASGVYYAMDSLQKVGFIPKTYAAEGIGFSGLKVYLDIWKIFRDLAYMIFVIVLIFAGFAIMFQWKIGGKTAVTLENALVKIVFAMIIINFSYAIAGFMIDLMYVFIGIIVSFLGRGITVNGSPADSAYIAGLTQNYINGESSMIVNSLTGDWDLIGGGFLSAAKVFIGGIPYVGALIQITNIPALIGFFAIAFRLASAILYLVPDILRWVLSSISYFIAFKFSDSIASFTNVAFLKPIADITLPTGADWGFLPEIFKIIIQLSIWVKLIPIILATILAFIIMATFFVYFLRIVFLAFFTYIQILIMVITAPMQLMVDAIPGQNRFINWLKGFAGLLSTFPVLIGTFLLARIIISKADVIKFISGANTDVNLWTPPFVSDGYVGSVHVTGGFDSQALLFLVGMAIMFMAPEFVKMTKKAIGGGGLPVKFSPGVFFGAAGAVTALPSLMGTAMFWGNFAPARLKGAIQGMGDKLSNNGGNFITKGLGGYLKKFGGDKAKP